MVDWRKLYGVVFKCSTSNNTHLAYFSPKLIICKFSLSWFIWGWSESFLMWCNIPFVLEESTICLESNQRETSYLKYIYEQIVLNLSSIVAFIFSFSFFFLKKEPKIFLIYFKSSKNILSLNFSSNWLIFWLKAVHLWSI